MSSGPLIFSRHATWPQSLPRTQAGWLLACRYCNTFSDNSIIAFSGVPNYAEWLNQSMYATTTQIKTFFSLVCLWWKLSNQIIWSAINIKNVFTGEANGVSTKTFLLTIYFTQHCYYIQKTNLYLLFESSWYKQIYNFSNKPQ